MKRILLLLVMFGLGVGLKGEAKPRGWLPVPVVTQASSYSCGAASLLSILFYWQVYDGNEMNLWPKLNTTEEQGTPAVKILEVAREFGLEAQMKEHQTFKDIEEAILKGQTVILDIQAWQEGPEQIPWKDDWEDGHYVVLIGMDQANLYFMDPSAHFGYGYIPRSEFMDRWHDYDLDSEGKPRRYFQMGIFISGKNPLKKFPDELVRIN